ncbi:metalloregulator ArsR/SmtB family transcription factor [Nesterenkonia pannonica]|uniref:ArsR/SmtB family transcription factor n=1 Tax=Nesterenkonia pannonica TaxID=1548602 RepID=UPI002164D9E5|nr:metalloregulator ArsR/SmtB family transcription factor [Nesterenkonia pannonica]
MAQNGEPQPAECRSVPPGHPAVDANTAVEVASRMKALSDPNRLVLLSLVAAGENAEACVCDLTEPVGLRQPTVSHHLKILVDAGYLTREKRGTWSYYSSGARLLEELSQTLSSLMPGTVVDDRADQPSKETVNV